MVTDKPSALDVRGISLLWASPERAGEVADIHAELFNPPWSREAVQSLLEHPYAAALVASAGEYRENAGFVMAQVAGDEAEILSLGVARKWQRLGLGRRLVEGLIRAVQLADARRLFLEVAVDNEAALKLYQSLDFRRVGRRPRYYDRMGLQPVDALILALDF